MQIRTEIGSEFWGVPTCESENTLFPEDTRWFLSGRSALSYIICDVKSKKDFRTVAMPSWCCDSMIHPFLSAAVSVRFYPVSVEAGKLTRDISGVCDCDAILVMDYFGYSSDVDYSGYTGTVIRDVTHSLLSKRHEDADYYFGSLRKWCGVLTGGFAYSKSRFSGEIKIDPPNRRYVSLRSAAMRDKSAYISGLSNDKRYLSLFSHAEKILESCCVVERAVEEDVECAKHLDVKFIRNARRDNAKQLMSKLSDIALFPQLHDEDCPLFVPIILPNEKRNALRRFLIENEIYCPVHWPVTDAHKLNERTGKIYDEELSIVCDWRYNRSDMKRICEKIEKFMQE